MLQNGTRRRRWSVTIGHSHAPDKKPAFFNLTLCQKRPMLELFVRELFVASDSVDCRTACSEDIRKVGITHGAVLSCHRINKTDKNRVVSYRLDVWSPGNQERFLLFDALFTRLMSSAPQLNRFLHTLTLI